MLAPPMVVPVLALLLALPAARPARRPRPPRQPAQVRAMLDSVTRQEELNDTLELHFDAVCAALKSGQRQLGPALTDPGAHPKVQQLVWVTGCSLRALKLSGAGARREVRLLWELEGRDALGARCTERGEADGEVRLEQGRWRLSRFTEAAGQLVRRPRPRFDERAQQVGLVLPAEREDPRVANFHVGGLAVRDLDGDGRPDVVAIQGRSAWLFRSRGPGLAFTRELLLTAPGSAVLTSVVAGDFDEDGDADLLLTAVPDAPSFKLRNEGGRFVEVGRQPPGGSILSGLASDLDGDGHLDLALLSYPLKATLPSDYLAAENGVPITLLRGDGRFGFVPWALAPGVLTHRWSLAAISADLLGQGRPQLYVANDFGDKDLWRFEVDGGLRNVAAEQALEDPGNGMSVDVGDLDGDGRLDLYLANMFSKAGTRVLAGATTSPQKMARLKKFAQGNAAYLARADGGFEEVGAELGLNRGLWAYGSLMTELDDDGRLEVAVANGFYSHPNRKDL